MGAAVTEKSVLSALTRARIDEIGRDVGAALRASATKEAEVDRLAGLDDLALPALLPRLRREELRSACRVHGLDAAGRARSELIARLLGSAPRGKSAGRAGEAAATYRARGHAPGEPPTPGQIVSVRHRQYLVEDVVAPPEAGHLTLVRLVCLDDDAPGRQLDVLWERELGARVLQPETHGLGRAEKLDPPRHFAAYLHALKWNCVTATDARLFQAPFRAGIRLYNHQLVPLKKALELPRVNLFIADDVGLGKTIEAGLVLEELILRQRVDQALIVCPASVALQWRDEMERRFGLRFEIYNREFVGRKRQERGYGTNPWDTYPRFIITYSTLRRPEYREPLLRRLGDRARKSLLILDEAHTAAPATASKYAVDSDTTGVVRDIAPHFEHRLFLSATPHNGHSNSFSSLLEMLDPQRFTRGVDVTPRQLDAVMVRRLKSDLLDMGVEGYPRRSVIQVDVQHEAGAWRARDVADGKSGDIRDIGRATDAEIALASMLRTYADAVKAKNKRGRLAMVNLQKRLLSSVEAFARTLGLHAKTVAKTEGADAAALDAPDDDKDGEYGQSDEAQLAQLDLEIAAASRALAPPTTDTRKLLTEMVDLAERARREPGAKVLALVDWIRRNQCPAVRIAGVDEAPSKKGKRAAKADTAWNDRRVIIFTEYADTKRHLREILTAAFDETDEGDARIMEMHGGMSDQQREDVQRAFNGPTDQYPVRVLLATDAAREGVNLQGHCADLFHFDVPWNPARLEQRNGRIDRTLQPSEIVRCHYFHFPQRSEDTVLATLVEKVEVIREELGSLSTVVLDRLADALADGITGDTKAQLDQAAATDRQREVAGRELEAARAAKSALAAEDQAVGGILEASKKVLDFDRALLRDAVDVGLEMAGGSKMKAVASPAARAAGVPQAFRVDEPKAAGWATTLDTLRPPRQRDEAPWDWRKRPLRPVVFEPPKTMTDEVVQLHLSHPLVLRVLDRFRAQGFAAHDLSRVAVVRSRRDALVRVIAFGRLSLFGKGATRLHEQVIGVAARWIEDRSGDKGARLKPFADAADRAAIDQLETTLAEAQDDAGVAAAAQKKLLATAPNDFAELWTAISHEAEAAEHKAADMLKARGAREAEALRAILKNQRAAIEKTLAAKQLGFDFGTSEADRVQKMQWDLDRKHMSRRLDDIDREMQTEPRDLEDLYRVVLRRLEPVGLVYLWPETR